MAVYRLTLHFSMSGNTRSGRWSNVFHYQSATPLADDGFPGEITPLVNAIRGATLDNVTIDRAVVKDVSTDGTGYDPTKVRTIPLGVPGQKVIGGDKPEIKEVVEVVRLKAATGRPGRNSYRMAILDSEVDGGGDGDPSILAGPAGATGLATAIQTAITGGFALLIYSKTKKGVVHSRLATGAEFAGVAYRTARRRRKRQPTGRNAKTWVDDAKTALSTATSVLGGYAAARLVVGALESAPIAAAVEGAGTAIGAVLPLLVGL